MLHTKGENSLENIGVEKYTVWANEHNKHHKVRALALQTTRLSDQLCE